MVIRTKNLQTGYKTSKKSFVKTGPVINLEADEGELVALLGKNGIGKSTFLKTISRLLPAISGEVLINQESLEYLSRNKLASQISFVSTEIVSNSYLTVEETVALGRFPYTNWIGTLSHEDIEIIQQAIKLVHLEELAKKPITDISDGERQRTMIARAIAQNTPIIILDEPTAFLDLQNKFTIVHLLSDLAHKQHKTILFSTHDLNIALEEADKIWLFEKDRALQAAPEELVMKNLFSSFWGNHVSFDKKTFVVKRKHTAQHTVTLISENKDSYFYTQKALNRIGFAISSDATMKIEISENPTQWHLVAEGLRQTFYSIYDICRQLSKQNLTIL